MPTPIPALCALPVTALRPLLEAGEITSRQLVQACLDCIALKDGDIHAFLETFPADALREAELSDERRRAGQALSPLDGVPVAVKDNIVMKGRRCSCGSRMLRDFVSPYDATAILRLRQAGLPILGRLNMDEFAMGGSTENSCFGPTRNPWNPAYVPGGSSGGPAAAVAAGMAPLALGSDTGGSIRQPAAFCGVAGVKPAYGTVSRYGLTAFASSFDQIGPLAKTVEDAALLMNVLGGGDPKDATCAPSLSADFAVPPAPATKDAYESTPLRGLTVGLPAECFGPGLREDVKAAVLRAAHRMEALGATLEETSIPALAGALSAYYVLSSAEASSNLARYDGVRYGYRTEVYADLDELYLKSRDEGFGKEVKRRVLLGTFALSSGYQDQYYFKAQALRNRLWRELDEALRARAALLTPVAPAPAYRLGEKLADPMAMYLGDVYTVPASLAGLPAVSLPCGLSPEGLPIGMSLTGARAALPALLRYGAAYERAEQINRGLHPYDVTDRAEGRKA